MFQFSFKREHRAGWRSSEYVPPGLSLNSYEYVNTRTVNAGLQVNRSELKTQESAEVD